MIGKVLAVHEITASGLAGGEVRGHQLDHLAGTHEQQLHLAQVFEQLRGQPHGRRSHADRMGADFGGGAHFLGHRERALKQLVQGGAQRAGSVGLAHRVFHLAQDLRFAQHHRIQARGHAERMAGGVAPFEQIGVALQLVAADAAVRSQPVDRRLDERAGVGRLAQVGDASGQRQIQLGAVAGGQDRGFGCGAIEATAQGLQRRAQAFGRQGKAPAQIDRRGLVVQTESEHAHEAIV
jgi:hypothetical protein